MWKRLCVSKRTAGPPTNCIPTVLQMRISRYAQAVRAAVGDDMKLMLDAMWAYQYADAVRVGRAMEELGYYWYEDPLVEEDIYNYVKLNQKLDIPVMCTEFAPGRFYGMAPWIMQNATDILRGDVAVTGGITPMVRLCHLAEGFNMRCEIHHGGNSLNNVANLHVTMAVPNCEFLRIFSPALEPMCSAWWKTLKLMTRAWCMPRTSQAWAFRLTGTW